MKFVYKLGSQLLPGDVIAWKMSSTANFLELIIGFKPETTTTKSGRTLRTALSIHEGVLEEYEFYTSEEYAVIT